MSLYIIDENQARQIAENFLQQHHSIIKIKQAVLEDEVWLVEVLVAPSNRTIKIKVNAKTGWIQGY
jgi:hypothetical protein